MRMLLDTHAFLWFVLGDSRCSQIARSHIENGANQLYLSPVSHWELAIKISIGKYKLPISFQDFIQRAVDENGFRFLPIDPAHTSHLTTMPFHHRDPFDRRHKKHQPMPEMPRRATRRAAGCLFVLVEIMASLAILNSKGRLVDYFATIARRQSLPYAKRPGRAAVPGVDGLFDEPDRAIAHQNIHAAGMLA